jgi:hypothetical protein
MVFVLFDQYCDETPGICKKLGMYRAKYDDMPIPQKSISIFRTKIGANYSGYLADWGRPVMFVIIKIKFIKT